MTSAPSQTSFMTLFQAALTQVFAGLTQGRSEVELLGACAPFLRALKASHAELIGVDGPALELLASWRPEGAAATNSQPALELPDGR
jgi:hypothetical protein